MHVCMYVCMYVCILQHLPCAGLRCDRIVAVNGPKLYHHRKCMYTEWTAAHQHGRGDAGLECAVRPVSWMQRYNEMRPQPNPAAEANYVRVHVIGHAYARAPACRGAVVGAWGPLRRGRCCIQGC